MKVVVDLPRLVERPLGMHIYAEHVLSNMLAAAPPEIEFTLRVAGLRGIRSHLKRTNDLNHRGRAKTEWVPMPASWVNRMLEHRACQHLYNSRYDIVHCLSGIPTPPARAKLVLTIQDALCLRLKESGEEFANYLFQLWRSAIPYCERVITISEFSKRELVDILDLPPDMVTVVYNGVDRSHFRPLEAAEKNDAAKRLTELGVTGPYLLQLGGLVERKNAKLTVEAFEILKSKYQIPHQLVFVGGHSMPAELGSRIEASAWKEEIVTLLYLEKDDALLMLQNAAALVFPSYYEGFGMPILEAMSCGVPVASSTSASLPEVGGEASEYFDAADAEGMAHVVQRLLSDADLRATRISQGFSQCAKFDWRNNAVQTLDLYRSICGANG